MMLYHLSKFSLSKPSPYLWRKTLAVGVGLWVIFCGVWAHTRRVQAEAREVSLAAVRSRVVSQVESLCRTLLPSEDTLRFQLTPYCVPNHGGTMHNGFAIDCLDEAGEQRVHLYWDDDARRCFRISVVPVSGHRSSNLPLRGASRPAGGSEWMCRLGMISDQEARGSRARVDKFASVVITRLYLPGQMVMAWTERSTGELRQAAVYSYPGAPEMQASGRPPLPSPPDA